MQNLMDILKEYDKLAVAFSGGVDSSVLLKAACEALSPEKVVALTLMTPLNPKGELDQLEALTDTLGVRHIYIHIDPLEVPEIRDNGPKRCYYCKRYMFGEMVKKAAELGFNTLADGTNADDAQGYRPGTVAAGELGVVSPLRMAGMTKARVRELADKMRLPQKNKPSAPCLATRVPYHVPLDEAVLKMIDRAEVIVRSYGISVCRVRHHGEIARIEVDPNDRQRLLKIPELSRRIKDLGYHFVCLDLDGYRSGSFDTYLAENEK